MSERKSMALRLDPAVHDALARWAADELRSTNAQIEFLLRRALADAAGCRTGPARCADPAAPRARIRPADTGLLSTGPLTARYPAGPPLQWQT